MFISQVIHAQSSNHQCMDISPFHADPHLVPRLPLLVTQDTEWLGLLCAHVEQMEHGQATRLHVTVSKSSFNKSYFQCEQFIFYQQRRVAQNLTVKS